MVKLLESLSLEVRPKHDVVEDVIRERLAYGPIEVPLNLLWFSAALRLALSAHANSMDSSVACRSCIEISVVSPPISAQAPFLGRQSPGMVLF
jgi:hypothetical protein